MPDQEGSTIQIAPVGPGGPSSTPSGGAAPGTSSSSSGTSGGGRAYDPYKAAQAAADKKEREAKRKASEKYIKQAQTLNQQAKALQKALHGGFSAALDIKLGNVLKDFQQMDRLMMEGYNSRVSSLEGNVEDNQKAEAAQSYANLTNRGRERSNALSEAMAQGAGESDVLRAQQMSLRNWSQNQAEVNRGFFDTARSINSSLTDLNVDTKTARANLQLKSNADREMLWNSFYEQESQAYTALGNIRGQQAELYGLANEAVASKQTKKRLNQAAKGMGFAYDQSAEFSSKAWKDPGITKGLMNWQGHDDFEANQNMSEYRNAQTDLAPKRPEGATLRAWSQ